MKKTLHYIQILCLSTFMMLGSTALTAGAKYIECGKSYWYSAPQISHYDHYNYSVHSCVSGAYDYKGADQMFYFDVHETSDVTIDMTGLHEDMDMIVFKKFEAWGYGSKFDDCAGASINHGKTSEKVTIQNAKGRYYIMVEAYKWGWSSGFDLQITCHEKPKAVSCHDYPVINCGDWKSFGGYYDQDKVTDVVDHHATCYSHYGTDHKGPEMIYRIGNGYGGLSHVTVDFHALNHGDEFDVFVYKWCESYWDNWSGTYKTKFSGLVNSCDYSTHYGDHSIYIDHVGYGEDLYVVVESKSAGWGYNSSFGNFKIAVTCGDVCDQSMDWMECNTKKSGSTRGRQNKASYYWQSQNSYSGHNWGPERTYRFKVDQMADYEFDLRVKTHSDLNMYIMNDCGAKECVRASTNYGKGKDEYIKQRLYPGTYYVVVEGYHGDSGDYDLEIKGCGGCHESKKLWCDTPVYGTTYGAKNDISQIRKDCFTNTGGVWLKGPDKTYSFKAPKAGYYEFTLTQLNKDLDLFLMSECHEVNSCLGFSTKTSNNDESITIHLSKNEEIYALVDSKSSSITSSFHIEVVCNPVVDEEPEEEPEEPEEEPYEPPVLSCFTATQDAGIINVDVSHAKLFDCEDATVELTVVPLDAAGNAIDSLATVLDIVDNSASFDPGINEEGTDYQICYSESCGDITKSCCQDFKYEALLSCGVTVSGTTKDGKSEFTALDIDECYSSSSSFNGPDVLVPFVKRDDNDVMEITMFQSTANLSLFILDADHNPVSAGCKGDNFNTTKDMSNVGAIGEFWTEDPDALLPAGRYYALIEGYATHVASDFTLNISCGIDCSAPQVIACGDSLSTQSTIGASNGQSSYAIEESIKVGYTGGEQVYQIDLADAADVEIVVSNISEGDLDVFLMDGACGSLAVMGQSITADDADETISMSLEAGTYYIVVDGWKGSAATFDLAVNGCSSSGLRDNIVASNRNGQKGSSISDISHEVYPNPFDRVLNIDITTIEKGQAQIRIMGVDGRVLHNSARALEAGLNQLQISEDELGTSTGLMYYEIHTVDHQFRGKIIRLN